MIRFDNLPEGVQTLTPYLCVKNGDAMIEFYKNAFGAEPVRVAKVPDSDAIMHASLMIGGFKFFINDEFPHHGALSPATTGQTSSSIHIQVSEGLDELYNQAVGAGATPIMPPADMFWGDRFAMLADPSGHKWSIGMAIPNPPTLDEEELKKSFVE
jgi:PhnB protein